MYKTQTHTYMQWNTGHEKERNVAICDNMDAPGGYNVKWNKSVRGKQIRYDCTYTWNLKSQNKPKPKNE